MDISTLLLGVALFADACAPGPGGEAAARASDAYVAGVELIAARRWEEAEASFLAALLLDPGIPLAHYGLGQARLELKRYAEAAAAFEASRDAYRCASDLSSEARRTSTRRLDATIRSLRETLRNLDQDRLQRSTILWQEINGSEKPRPGADARTRDAIEAQIAQIERLKSRRSDAGPPAALSLALGTAYFHAGNLVDAEREFRTAAAADPGSGDAYNNLAVVLMLTGRLEKAEQAVKAAEKRGVAVSPRLKEVLRARESARPPR